MLSAFIIGLYSHPVRLYIASIRQKQNHVARSERLKRYLAHDYIRVLLMCPDTFLWQRSQKSC